MADEKEKEPRLVAVEGPLRGSVYRLGQRELTIGRESSNAIPISDASLSRRHCIVRFADGEYELVDLQSLNGTTINGERVTQRRLEHGNQVALGNSRFVFLTGDLKSDGESNPVSFNEENVIAATTMRVRIDDALYLQQDPDSQALPPIGQIVRDLAALVRISTTVNAVRDSEALQRKLLELIFEVVPADHGAIVLVDQNHAITSVFGSERNGTTTETISVSRNIVRQALDASEAVLNNDVVPVGATIQFESLASSGVRSVLCAPLILFSRPLGAIYLYTTDPSMKFAEEHLHFLTMVSGIAAVAIENARHVERLEDENQLLRDDFSVQHNMIGDGPAIERVYQFISRAAPTSSTVLITGESGTGKELVAHAIHMSSSRAEKPFVAINCAALTETLLESELFGHERGAFTGAVSQKKGKFELADGGTLFLDEIGELASVLQAKLLRALQEREVERVGGSRPIPIDVRLIAATNRDLDAAVKDGSFRQDLFYRLNVVACSMPALRERREDIASLAEHFARKHATKFNRKVSGISQSAMTRLESYSWPGNIRELENAIERAVVLGSTDVIHLEDLPENILETTIADAKSDGQPNYHEALRDAKKQIITDALAQAGGNYTEAAKRLGVHPNYLHRLVTNLNLRTVLKGR